MEKPKKRDRAKYYNAYREKTRQKIREYKLERGCCVCGYKKCAAALLFHHVRDDKKYQITRNLGCRCWKTLKLEIDKCDILCANCHNELHYS